MKIFLLTVKDQILLKQFNLYLEVFINDNKIRIPYRINIYFIKNQYFIWLLHKNIIILKLP